MPFNLFRTALEDEIDILNEVGGEPAAARPHENLLAREAVAMAASQFRNVTYREAVFLWLTLEGIADEKKALVGESEESACAEFFFSE